MKKFLNVVLIFVILFVILNTTFCNIVFAVDNEESNEAEQTGETIEESSDELTIDAEAAYLMEINSENVSYEKNADEILYPASTTKIMTAIIIIENCDLDDTTIVSQNAIDLVPSGYTNAGLVAGEELTIEDLLYALMLASANEAANVLAEHLSGSIDNFAILMTEKAKELGCENTNFLNANGMHNENHYTTAKDLCIIANYCIQNETFRKIISTLSYTIPATDQHPEEDRVLTNTDRLINSSSEYYYEYAIGGKTGFTTEAGYCLVCFAEKSDVLYTCVVLKASSTANRFNDAKNLLAYGFENFSNQIIVSKGSSVGTIEVENATSESKTVELVTNETIYEYVKNDFDEELEYEVSLNDDISAPIYAGTEIGTATYTLKDKTYTVPIIAKTSAYEAHNYSIYILVLGLILLVISVILIVPKKKR